MEQEIPNDSQKEVMEISPEQIEQLNKEVKALEDHSKEFTTCARTLMQRSLKLKRKVSHGLQIGLLCLSLYYSLGNIAIKVSDYWYKSTHQQVHSSHLTLLIFVSYTALSSLL